MPKLPLLDIDPDLALQARRVLDKLKQPPLDDAQQWIYDRTGFYIRSGFLYRRMALNRGVAAVYRIATPAEVLMFDMLVAVYEQSDARLMEDVLFTRR